MACRSRRPVETLLGLRVTDGQLQVEKLGGQAIAPTANGTDGDGRLNRKGKGSYCCPDRKCAERAVSALLRLGRRHGTTVAEHPAVPLLRHAAEEAERRTQLRAAGLARRGIEARTDVLVGAWSAAATRCRSALETGPTSRASSGQRDKRARERDLGCCDDNSDCKGPRARVEHDGRRADGESQSRRHRPLDVLAPDSSGC